MDLDTIKEALTQSRFDIAGTTISVATLILFLMIVVITLVVSSLIQRIILRIFKARGIEDAGTTNVATRLTHYTILLIGLGIGLDTVGIRLGTLFAAGAVLAIGVGFAMQNLTQNFVAGVILLLERAIKPGDVLRVEDRLVRVTRMAMRTTQARTLDDEEIIVPNSAFVQSTVTNYTMRDSIYRLRCPVRVTYSSDMAQVRRVLEQVSAKIEWRLQHKTPVVFLTGFGSSSVDWEVSVWIDHPWEVNRARSELNEAIWWALKDAGIVIAFKQVDIHFDPPVIDFLETHRQAS